MKLTLSLLCGLILVAGVGLPLYWRHYWTTFEAGAERGARFAARYEECYGKRPSEAAIRRASHFVNDPYCEPCEWSAMFEWNTLSSEGK